MARNPTPDEVARMRRVLNGPGTAERVTKLRQHIAEAIDADRNGQAWPSTGDRLTDRWVAELVAQDRANRDPS